MATKGRTIDPKKITNIASWAKAFGRGYINLVKSHTDAYLVLDPKKVKEDFESALAEPVKTIPHLYGSDYINILNNPHAPAELRAAAETKAGNIRTEINARVIAARLVYTQAEQELLTAVDNWTSAADSATRTVTAGAVGAASKAVAAAEAELRDAAYPHKYIKTYSELTRGQLPPWPGIGDTRRDVPVVRAFVPLTTVAADRVIAAAPAAPAAAKIIVEDTA